MSLDVKAEADRLDAYVHQRRQALQPELDFLRAIEEMARRFRREGRPGPVKEQCPPPGAGA